VETDGDDESREPDERLRQLAEFHRMVAAPESRLDHHVLAVVRPPFDKRHRREERGLPYLRRHLPQVLVVKKVARIDLVNRNIPERRHVEVAHVLFLPIGRPVAVDVSEVVIRPTRLRLERPRRPHARERPSVEVRRWRHDDLL
jgi:hypothetical protein